MRFLRGLSSGACNIHGTSCCICHTAPTVGYSFLAFARLRRFWFAAFFARIVCFRLDVRGCCRTLYHYSQLRYFLVVGVASRDSLDILCSWALTTAGAVRPFPLVLSQLRQVQLPSVRLFVDAHCQLSSFHMIASSFGWA